MWETFQRFRALDAEAQKIFGRAVVLFPLVVLSLRLRGFKRTKSSLQARLSRVSRSANAAERIPAICRMVKAAGHYGFVNPNCLEESLVLWYFLERENISAVLRIGVRKLQGKFEAHAWVENEGVALNHGEWTQPHYAAFESEFAELPGETP
jgi:hypothetical protein